MYYSCKSLQSVLTDILGTNGIVLGLGCLGENCLQWSLGYFGLECIS